MATRPRAPHPLAAPARQDGDRSARRAAPTSTASWRPRGRRDATALGRLFAGDGRGARARPRRRAAAHRSRWSRRPPARRRRPSWCWPSMADPPERRFDEDLYGADPEEVLALPPRAARRRRGRHGGRATTRRRTPSRRACCRPATRRAATLAVRQGFPTCALGVYRSRSTHWADVDGRGGQAGRPAGPAVRQGADPGG